MKTDGTNSKQVAEKKPATLTDWLMSHKDSLQVALPKGTIDIDRFMQSALLAIYDNKNVNIAKCTPESIYRSLKESASLGLEVGGVLGQAYLIPYNESYKTPKGWQKVMTCHFQCGYKGLIALARRSNTIKTIACEPVYSNDIFTVQLGCDRKIDHRLDLSKSRGEIIGYYCLIELTNGGIQFDVESVADIEKHRDKFSKSYKKDDPENVWNKNFDAMALKTCCIKALKLCPISIEALEVVRKEEISDIKEPETPKTIQKTADVEDVEFTVTDTPEPVEEVKEEPKKAKKEEVKEKEPETVPENGGMSQEEMDLVSQAFDGEQKSFEGMNPEESPY